MEMTCDVGIKSSKTQTVTKYVIFSSGIAHG